jgi:hypothetical protein
MAKITEETLQVLLRTRHAFVANATVRKPDGRRVALIAGVCFHNQITLW